MSKVQAIHDTDPATPNQIEAYMHCATCLEEWLARYRGVMAPKDYARTQAGITEDGRIQVWCNRHDCNVDLMTFRAKGGR